MAKVSASGGAVFLLGHGEEQELPRWRSGRKCLQKEIADAHTVPGLTSESDSTRCGRAGGGKWARLAGEEARRVGWGQVRTVPLSYVLRLPPIAVAELVRVFKKSIDIRNSKAWK